jgi:hypothetical protein
MVADSMLADVVPMACLLPFSKHREKRACGYACLSIQRLRPGFSLMAGGTFEPASQSPPERFHNETMVAKGGFTHD